MHSQNAAEVPRDPAQSNPPGTLNWRVKIRKGARTCLLLVFMYDTIVSATLTVAAVVYFSGLSKVTSPVLWIAMLPFLYLLWVTALLSINAIATAIILRLHPKPRSFVASAPDSSIKPLAGIGICYHRWQMIRFLPFVSAHMGGCRWLRRFAMRSYGGKVLCANALLLAEFPFDPDLTEIGEGTVIGGGCILTAHAFNTLPDGRPSFASAMIKIGKNVTIGAGSRIEMGCQIGDGAALEPGSMLPPFSRIGPNEIWCGVPATFRRMRASVSKLENNGCTATAKEVTVFHDDLRIDDSSAPSVSPVSENHELAQRIVRSTLGGKANHAEWDSLDQMAIALAIHSQTGRAVAAEEIFKLHTIDQVAAFLHGNTGDKVDLTGPADRSVNQLPENPELLPLLNRREVSRLLAVEATHSTAHGQGTTLKSLPIKIAASYTADMIQQSVERWGRRFGIEPVVQFAGFNQIPQTLLDPESIFARNAGGLNVVLLAAEDLPPTKEIEYVEGMLQAIEAFLRGSTLQSRLCLATMPLLVSEATADRRQSVEQARTLWNSRITTLADVDVIDCARVVESLGTTLSYDAQLYRTASCPYSMDALNEFGIELVRSIRKSVRARAKVIAVDCDHTLWGGVVGEAGLTGIDLGDGAHGKFHLALQRWILAKKEEGLLVAIVSRNEEADVWTVFENHSEMILRKKDIVAHRINWLPKSQNLKSLAEELNVSLDSFVFLDDDPAVRLEVATSLPQVTVIPLEQPDSYVDLVEKLWAFDALSITSDDRRRTEMMLGERDRKEYLEKQHSLGDYLAGLQLKVAVKEADEVDLPRVAQLIQKTNQFNLSTIRRTLEEIRLLADARILTISVVDRFGDYGLVGVVILRPEDGDFLLDTFLLSCRVLGRHVENAVLAAIREICVDLGAKTLRATVVETARNQPARQFVKEAGFTETATELWEWQLATDYTCPAQIELTIQLRDSRWTADQKLRTQIATVHV